MARDVMNIHAGILPALVTSAPKTISVNGREATCPLSRRPTDGGLRSRRLLDRQLLTRCCRVRVASPAKQEPREKQKTKSFFLFYIYIYLFQVFSHQ